MKLVTLIMIACCLHVSAKGVSQTITLSGTSMALQKVFSEIKKQTGFLFFYRNEDLAGTTPVSIKLKAASLPRALETILHDQPLSYSIQGNTVFITKKPAASVTPPEATTPNADTSAPLRVHGFIYNEEGEPIPGASVHTLDTRQGMSATPEGEFRLMAQPGSIILISSIGYAPAKLRVKRKDNEFSVTLIHSDNKLDQVQVIAYGTTTRGLLTSPISTVKAKDIRNFPLTSFDQMLQGLASGVFVTSGSGAPGRPAAISIRGATSVNDPGPLVVIDGMPIVAGSLDDQSMGPLDNLAGIDPTDIASIDILKDAGSTAIYGSRAAGGVILITTKRGKAGKTIINLNGTQGVGTPTGRLSLLNTPQYIALQREAFHNDNPGQPLPAYLATPDSTTETNWQNLVYKPTTISEYKVNASGGNTATQFFLSGGYRKETNPLSGKKGLDRETIRLNLDHQASKRLKFSTSLAASRTGDQNTADNSSNYGAAEAALAAPPNLGPYDSAGNFTVIPLPSGAVGNPLASFSVKLNNVVTQLKTSVGINFEILNGLDFHADLGYDYNGFVTEEYIPKAVNATLGNTQYDARRYNNVTTTYSIEPQLRLHKNLGSHHVVEAVAGSTFQKRQSTTNTLYGKGFPSDDIQELDAAATTFGSSSDVTYAFNSVFGRVNYIYDSKFIVNASFRRDGSSRFGPDNRFGNFGAVSGAWVFSHEKFASNWNFLSNGKLRSSYGIVGNDAIGDFTYIDNWQPFPYGGQPGSRPSTAESPNVKWERTQKFDLGADLSFLHDRIGVTFNYYYSQTGNLLVTKPVASQTGFTIVEDNLPALVVNNGEEFELNTVNVRTSDFQWTSKLNITHSRNIMKSFPGLATNTGYNLRYVVGKSLYLIWGYKFQGVDPSTGNPKYDGFNPDGTPKDPTASNPGYQYIADNFPKYHGGITNNFTYKGFSLDVFLQFVQGLDAYNPNGLLDNSSSGTTNQVSSVLQRWTQKGDVTNVPRSATLNTAWWVTSSIDERSSRFVSDGSYWRVKNVTLGYSLQAKALSRMKMREVRLYVSGENLATHTHFRGVDPETHGDVAPTRMVVGGINLGF